MFTQTKTILSTLLSASLLAACAPEVDEGDYEKGEDGKADSSALATIMDFEFDGELLADYVSSGGAQRVIQDQLLYTIGHLNGNNSVGRLDRLQISGVTTAAEGGKTRVRYHAKMPVAWGSKTNLPTTYTFKLPRDVSYGGTDAFTEKYKHDCVDYGAHDVDAGSMWYYYRPNASGCSLASADIVTLTATTTVSTVNTTGKFPEYHKVWEDDALKVVAVFGKYEDGATTASDAGIAAYNEFVGKVKSQLSGLTVTTTPSTIPTAPGVGTPDIQWVATLPGGRTIQVNALLVDNVRTAGATFDARYEALSTRADLIAYNGHAGLGSNVRALAQKGDWVAGQYVIVFMNGCDTYAYVDGSLAETRAAINPDDPSGTKYMEFVVNAMPAYFHSDAGATMAIMSALKNYDAPKTYEQIFRNIDSAQIVLVTGEQDNVYVPGYGEGGGGSGGFTSVREVTSASQGESLMFNAAAPAGTFLVKIAHDPSNPGGDADLYVRAGSQPTTSTWDCRPYLEGSDEECRVTLSSPKTIYAMVNGYAAGENHFVLTIEQEGGSTPPPPSTWSGLDESGTIAKGAEKRWQTPTLAPATYVFEMTGTNDADLYVRVGTAPTTTVYDCRPYKSSSNETCVVPLSTAAPIHIMVRGYATSSTYHLIGGKQ